MSKLLQKFASEKLSSGGGETALSKKRKRVDEDVQEQVAVTSKVKVNSALRPTSANSNDKRKGGKKNKTASESSIVYLGHIPKGFEEEEIEGFFSQFGEVKKMKVFRNVRTNNIRGYAFIQFETPEVAEVAAEAIDGYFLNDRKLVCHVIPPENIHRGMFARPELTMLEDAITMELLEDAEEAKPTKKRLTVATAERQLKQHQSKMQKQQQKLKELGYDFEFPTSSVSLTNSESAVSTKVAAVEAPTSTKKASKVATTVAAPAVEPVSSKKAAKPTTVAVEVPASAKKESKVSVVESTPSSKKARTAVSAEVVAEVPVSSKKAAKAPVSETEAPASSKKTQKVAAKPAGSSIPKLSKAKK